MSDSFKRGSLQHLSRITTNKYNVSISALILIDAIQDVKHYKTLQNITKHCCNEHCFFIESATLFSN